MKKAYVTCRTPLNNQHKHYGNLERAKKEAVGVFTMKIKYR
jgi:hypothetical protein